MEDQYNLVFNQMFTNDATVKRGGNTLKAVVTDKNLTDLFTLLEQPGQTETLRALQQAINAALLRTPG